MGNATLDPNKGVISVKSLNPSSTRAEIESKYPFDVLGISKKKGEVHIYGTLLEFLTLKNAGYNVEFITGKAFEKFIGVHNKDLITDFKNLTQIKDDLTQLSKRFPQQSHLVSLMKEFNIPKTVEGNEIWALKISSNAAVRQDKPKIAFIGNHHAREIQTPEAALDTAHWLLENYNSDARAKKWVDQNEIWVVPVANPDGYDYVYKEDPMWRKNRNGEGVDLNRNYPFHWGGCGSNSTEPNSEVYIGPKAGSEAEVQALMALSKREHFWISISYHSYGEEVLYPYLCHNLPGAEIAIRDQIVDEYKDLMGYDKRVASSDGEDFEWRFNQVGGLDFLVEVSDDFQPNYDEFMKNEIPRIRAGWFYLFEKLQSAVLTGTIVDKSTQKPIEARIELKEISYSENETRTSNSDFGRFFWFLKPGQYTLKVSKEGYATQFIPFNLNTKTTELKIELQK